MTLDVDVTFADTVIMQKIDGQMVLLDMESEKYFGLDDTATAIWEAIQENKNLNQVLKTMINSYDVEEKTLEKNIVDFVGSLNEKGLVKLESA